MAFKYFILNQNSTSIVFLIHNLPHRPIPRPALRFQENVSSMWPTLSFLTSKRGHYVLVPYRSESTSFDSTFHTLMIFDLRGAPRKKLNHVSKHKVIRLSNGSSVVSWRWGVSTALGKDQQIHLFSLIHSLILIPSPCSTITGPGLISTLPRKTRSTGTDHVCRRLSTS